MTCIEQVLIQSGNEVRGVFRNAEIRTSAINGHNT